MMSMQAYLAFVVACIALALLPGPIVTLVIANGLRYGTRAALTNVAGAQAGLAIVIGIVAIGLTSLMATMGYWFDWVRFAGAAYLIWLGIKLIRSKGELITAERTRPRGSFFLQGLMVILSNPKVLLVFGALIPQFIVPEGDYVRQLLFLGVTFMVVATIFDSIYAFAAGGAGSWLSRTRIRAIETVSGLCLIGGGVWLALRGR